MLGLLGLSPAQGAAGAPTGAAAAAAAAAAHLPVAGLEAVLGEMRQLALVRAGLGEGDVQERLQVGARGPLH